MEIAQLRYFITIAEALSFTEAAKMVHVSQPALSYQMRRLEEELGTRLFDRKGRRIALTPDGELFLPLAHAVLTRASEAVRILRGQSRLDVGETHIGGNPSVATYLFPVLIASFRRAFPSVRVEVVEGGDLDLQRRVQTGALDFAVVTAPGSPQTLEVTPLGKEDLLVVTPPTHRIASRESIELAELAFDDFVLPDKVFNLTAQIIDACRRAGFEPRVTYQAGSLESVKNFVRQGLGVSMVPNLALTGPGHEGLAVLEVQGRLTRELNLICGRDRTLGRAAQVLMMHVRTSVAAHMRYPVVGPPPAEDMMRSGPASRPRRSTGPEDRPGAAGPNQSEA